MRYLTFRTGGSALAGAALLALYLTGVAEAVTSNIFRYDAPKTGAYGLSPMAFAPADNNTGNGYLIFVPNDLRLANPSATGCFVTGVNLPQGAVMSSFTVWYGADTNNTVTAQIYRTRSADGTNNAISQLNSTDTTGFRKSMSNNILATTTSTVNNLQYVYGVQVCLGNLSARYFAGRITYTYNNAGD